MKKIFTLPIAAVLIIFALFFAIKSHTNNNVSTDVKGETTSTQTTSAKDSVDETENSSTDSTSEQTGSGSSSTNYSTTSSNTKKTSITKSPSRNVLAVVSNSSNTPSNPTLPVPVTPTPVDPTPVLVGPTVAITSPAAGAAVSGVQTITATASDDKSVSQVAFTLDGQVVSTVAAAPYSYSWNTATAVNGSHSISAVATDSDNLSTTSAIVNVTVNNQVVVPPTDPTNLISNPSVETSTNNVPTGWSAEGYGTNDRTFTYENTGHTGSHSLKTTITTMSDVGDAKWFFTPVTITAGGTYKYSNWYKSDADTQLNVMVNFADGTTQYFYLTAAPKSADWAQINGTFTMPANAVSATVFQALTTVGYVQVDDFSFASYQATPFARGLVTLTFDDGWRSIYTNGLPLLNKYGLVSTQYLLTSTVDYPDYMTVAMMQAFKDSGSEIAAHTVNHCDLTGQQTEDPIVCPTPISASQVQSELNASKTDLQNWFGVNVTDFATPYGAYNADVIAAIKAAGYTSHRSTDVGFNSADGFNPYNIKVQNITNTTTVDQVKAWVDQAIADKTWLVIVFHEVDANVADPTYAVTPANLDQELAYIKQTGVAVVTVSQALQELTPQTTP